MSNKPAFCPACGRALNVVGWVHECGINPPRPVIVMADDEPDAVDQARQGFDKVAYQREYMRRRRANAGA